MSPCVLPYPDRFTASAEFIDSLLPQDQAKTDETRLILYALSQQATQGQCKASTPWFGDPAEKAKLTTWKNLGNVDKFEAMRLCVLPYKA